MDQALDDIGIAAFAYDTRANEIKVRSEARQATREAAIAAAGGTGGGNSDSVPRVRLPRVGKDGNLKQP